MNNSLLKIILAVSSLFLLSACDSWLEEKNYGNPTAEDLVSSEKNIPLIVGQAYADIKWLHDHWGYWGVNALASDECVCPVRNPGKHWSDGGYWSNLNTHNWDAFGDAFKNIWNSTISGAVLCNRVIKTLESNKSNMNINVYNQYVGELEVLRSYYYYNLFDCFGRIPYQEEFKQETVPLSEPSVVWSKLVNSLEKNAPNLPVVTDANRATNYGRVTQGFAYALLARLYLNAESYGCTPQNVQVAGINNVSDFYTKCASSCQKVIDSGSYTIETDFFKNFAIENQDSKENIFVIVEDGNADFDNRSNGSMSNKLRMIILTLHYSQQTTYNLIEKPWNGFAARPKFIQRYEPTDVRGPGNEGMGTKNTKRWGWFVGKIYNEDGSKQMTNEDDSPVEIVPQINSLTDATWNDGARMFKYEIDKQKKYAFAENDFVLFRYADVLYMNEEAILRGGSGTSGINSSDFQRIRKRAFAYDADGGASKVYTSLTLNELADERGREFAWENIRRRDLIRFGKFNDPNYIDYVSATDNYRKWFPIPFSVIEKSPRDSEGKPLWTQNEGY